MTDKPTPEQIQRACDLASEAAGMHNAWTPKDYRHHGCLTALADTIAKLDAKDAMVDGQAALIATLTAERDEARSERAAANIRASELKMGFDKAAADLAEIAVQLDLISDDIHRLSNTSHKAIREARAIAAPYRVEADPLVAVLRGKVANPKQFAESLRTDPRWLEIGRQA